MKQFIKKTVSLLIIVCTLITVCFSTTVSAANSILKSSSLYFVSNNCIYDVTEGTTLSNFLANFSNSFTVYKANGSAAASSDKISTGCYFTVNSQKYTVIVAGDVDGSGVVDATDYARVKNYFLNKITFKDYEIKASDVDASSKVDATDYLKIKSAFLKAYDLQSSKEYANKKSLVSQLMSGAEKISSFNDINAVIDISATTNIGNIDIDGTLLATGAGTNDPDFSFKLDASSGSVVYPLANTCYKDGTLYTTTDNGAKYKTTAPYSVVSKYLSTHLIASPITADGSFVLIPSVDKETLLGEKYFELSSVLKSITSTLSGTSIVYTFNTDNIVYTEFFKDMFVTTNENLFGGLDVIDIYDSVNIAGTAKVNAESILYDVVLNLTAVMSDKVVSALGPDTPKNMNVSIHITFKDISLPVTVNAPTSSDYITLDNIYTQHAFTAYDNLISLSSALSTSYSETLTIGSKSSYLTAKTNAKNTAAGVELNRTTNTTISGIKSTTNLYIGNSYHITDENGPVTSTSLNTSTLSVDKMGIYFNPHYNTLNDINNLFTFTLTEEENAYILKYTVSRDYALSLLENSLLLDNSALSSALSGFNASQYTLTQSSGTLTFSKDSYEVVANSCSMSFKLLDNTTVTYAYNFTVLSTDFDTVKVDSSLLNK